MKKNRIIVVYSSHLSDEEDQKFNQHIENTIGVKNFEILRYVNHNQYSLPQIYNQALKNYDDDNSIFVFCHNDIKFRTKNWGKILLNKFNKNPHAIIGLAGSTYFNDGVWWKDRTKMYGTVEHTNGISEWVSEYSDKINNIQDVVVIDGLFIAVDPNKIKHNFDENYGKFHMYEISFCLKNYLDDVDIGVIDDIRVLHKSMGETDKEWENNRIKLVEEYSDYFPIKLVPEKLRVLICCQFFKNYTGSEISNYELAKGLKEIGCDVTVISTIVGDPVETKAKKAGIKVYNIAQAPNYIVNQEKQQLQFFKNQAEFDIIHINHKPIGQQILQMYPNTPAVMHIRSEVIPKFEEPIIHPMIKRYISIRDSITEYIKTFGIDKDKIVHIDNPFDTDRFNTNYKSYPNQKEIILFVGTLDYLRKNILFDLRDMTKENGQELWIVGSNNDNYLNDLLLYNMHVQYFGVQSNVEDYIKKCDYTAGIFKGRTTIEGFLCGKPSWIYKVDKNGNILSKELTQVPDDLEKYKSSFSAEKVFILYDNIIDETWF